MRICVICGSKYRKNFNGGTTKYCSVFCKNTVRNRVQKRQRQRSKKKAEHNLDYCSHTTYIKYRYGSPKRGLEFSLTTQDFRDNIEKPCYYCNDVYKGIGFDRIDNDIGYHLYNIVPCCPECNRMKRTQSKADFIERCVKIAETFGYIK